MKMIVAAVLALVAVAMAAPVDEKKEEIVITKSEFVHTPEGGYNYGYETSNGIVRSETGEVKEAVDDENKPHLVVVVRGAYTYPDEEGKPISITYIADEKGFQPEGDSIPKNEARR